MSVSSGFFNSLSGDRRYNAEQMSAIFDGVINDGVFANVGNTFNVKAESGNNITVDVGRAWFNSKWIYNDAILPLSADVSEVVLDRIDAVVIEVNRNDSVRSCDIKIIKGTPASSPQRPAMSNSNDIYQHPLAYINRKAGSKAITQADITSMIGTSDCPYITSILQVTNIDNVVAQWKAQWDLWYSEEVKNTELDRSEWMSQMKNDFEDWFYNLQASLEMNQAAYLSNQVLELQKRFKTLIEECAIYEPLEDGTGDTIIDGYGNMIEAKTTFNTSTYDEETKTLYM